MKKLLLSGAALAALVAGPAVAADLAVPIYKGPPPIPMFSWTGCYIGGSVGGGYAWTENTNAVNTTLFGDFGPGQGYANYSSGFAGGGQLGCNYQVSRFVIGVEGSYLWANIKRDYVSPFGGADDVYTNQIDGIASVAARFGMAFDTWLFYTKVGWAAAHAKLSVVDSIPPTGAGTAQSTGRLAPSERGSTSTWTTWQPSRPPPGSRYPWVVISDSRQPSTSTRSAAASGPSTAGSALIVRWPR